MVDRTLSASKSTRANRAATASSSSHSGQRAGTARPIWTALRDVPTIATVMTSPPTPHNGKGQRAAGSGFAGLVQSGTSP